MNDQKTAVVDPVAGVFCPDGLAPGRIVVTVPENPDPRRQRYSGLPETPLRMATAEELVAYDAAQGDGQLEQQYADPVLRTTLLWTLTRLLGHTPSAAEKATAKAEWKAIRKALG
jgi:hypothetical protein